MVSDPRELAMSRPLGQYPLTRSIEERRPNTAMPLRGAAFGPGADVRMRIA